VLDQTCAVWRDGVVLQIEDNEYKVHLKSFTNKYECFYSKAFVPVLVPVPVPCSFCACS